METSVFLSHAIYFYLLYVRLKKNKNKNRNLQGKP